MALKELRRGDEIIFSYKEDTLCGIVERTNHHFKEVYVTLDHRQHVVSLCDIHFVNGEEYDFSTGTTKRNVKETSGGLVLRVGQIIGYTHNGGKHIGKITQMDKHWLYVNGDILIRNTWVDAIIAQDASSEWTNGGSAKRLGLSARREAEAHQARLKVQAVDTANRIERSAGQFDYELDKAQRALMIDYALDTRNEALFMELTTQRT